MNEAEPDVFDLVRKIGAPGNWELAVAAIAEGADKAVVDSETMAVTGTSQSYVDGQSKTELQEIARRRALYLNNRAPLPVEGRTAVVVDDGLATGSTAPAAVQSLRARKPARIVLAVPVAPPEAVADLQPQVDELVCLSQPEFFGAVGSHYADFHQVSDEEVIAGLARVAREIPCAQPAGPHRKGTLMQEPTDLVQGVMAALEFAGCIAPHRLPVEVAVIDCALVLQGEVENIKAKRSAVRIASEIAGAEGLALDERLHVALSAPRADGDMLDALGDALLASREFINLTLRRHHGGALEVLRTSSVSGTSGELEFAVRDGVVELAGTVPSLSHRRLAEVLAWWIGGCRNVINRLRVEPTERDGDDELADAVGLVLEVDPALPESQPIGVWAEAGVVRLTGALRTETQRQRAEQDAWCVEGVRDVRNDIEVAS